MRHSLPVVVVLVLLNGCWRAEPMRPTSAEPDARIAQALQLRAAGQREQALALLEKVRADALARGDAPSAAMALHRSADVLEDLGRGDEARSRYEQALEEHLRDGDVEGAGMAANDRGLAADGWDEQALWFAKAVGYRRAVSNLAGLRISANNLGTALFYLERWDEAARAYEEAVDAAKRLGDAAAEEKVEANLALLFAVRAEGGFPQVVEDAPPPVSADNPNEQQARAHFAAGLDAARRAGDLPERVCAYFGRYENRCPRLGGTIPKEDLDDAAALGGDEDPDAGN